MSRKNDAVVELDAKDRIQLLGIAVELGVASWEIISFAHNLEQFVLGKRCTDTPLNPIPEDRLGASQH